MPAWLLPAITSVLATGASVYGSNASNKGQREANEMNREIAREQMAFQERMSNTAAQRARQDFINAGLNPALAYGTQASTPMGASATMQNPVQQNPLAQGVSTAMQVREHMQAMKNQQETHEENLRVMATNRAAAKAAAEKAQAEQRLIDQNREFNRISQPYDLRLGIAEAMLREAMIPGAQNEARFNEMMGLWAPAISSAGSLTNLIGGVKGLLSKPASRNMTKIVHGKKGNLLSTQRITYDQ